MSEQPEQEVDYKALSLNDAIKVMSDIKNEIDVLNDRRAILNKKYDLLRMGVIPEKMDEAGESTKTIVGIGRITLQADVFASIPAPNREAAFEWLDENGHGDIVKETVNAGTLKALMKSLIRKGTPIPEDIFKVTPVTRAVITSKGVNDD